jgi:hypothetical protein
MNYLTKLGFRRRQQRSLRELFGPPGEPPKRPQPIKPDVDYHPEEERKPQAPNYAGMWIDHFSNMGNIHDPVGSPMESGA